MKLGPVGDSVRVCTAVPRVRKAAQVSLAPAVVLGLFVLALAPEVLGAPRTPTVAVLPFRDLASGSRFIGEAIRETVTADLKQLGLLRVVDRGSLDRVLAEQKLQVEQKELDPASAARVGKILGATLILIGAYQKVAPQIRLTARFIKVETSEVIGTAKVDGPARDFLHLQDRITAALLRSAGLAIRAKQLEDKAPGRPELLSLQTLELYGQAITAPGDSERQRYLAQVVAQDKHFSYALKDLAALEERIKAYQSSSQRLWADELHALQEQIRRTTDRAQADLLMMQYLGKLAIQYRWYGIVAAGRAFFDALPPEAALSPYFDGVALSFFNAEKSLKDDDALLADGELFLKRAPGSGVFPVVKGYVEQAIEHKRSLEEGRSKAEKEISELDAATREDPCRVGDVYRTYEQYDRALRQYELCSQQAKKPRLEVLSLLILTASNGGRWSTLRTLLAELETLDARAAQQYKIQYRGWMPEDLPG